MQLLGAGNESEKGWRMKIIALLVVLTGLGSRAQAEDLSRAMSHEMQHGFILGADDTFASHLVATGHHSWQVDITGQLSIDDQREKVIYQEHKSLSAGATYFLFQAQGLDLPSLKDGQILRGHIVESKVGDYSPKNIIVKAATYKVTKVLLNLENPFFKD